MLNVADSPTAWRSFAWNLVMPNPAKPEPKIFIYNSFRHSLDKRESSNQYFLKFFDRFVENIPDNGMTSEASPESNEP